LPQLSIVPTQVVPLHVPRQLQPSSGFPLQLTQSFGLHMF
jgi:hypothetical protein